MSCFSTPCHARRLLGCVFSRALREANPTQTRLLTMNYGSSSSSRSSSHKAAQFCLRQRRPCRYRRCAKSKRHHHKPHPPPLPPATYVNSQGPRARRGALGAVRRRDEGRPRPTWAGAGRGRSIPVCVRQATERMITFGRSRKVVAVASR